ncbi:MAG: UTP--glucose-1-phosphate uridylyltransferase [Candidatus Nealsonbacteria bacterium]|nr:MAG: UTP--glucose-1-phosphate uridylyltransferase [Candidatus Nealsonbacteria bacterium]
MAEVKKAVILVAGLATRFLPLSKAVPKEILPLADKPIIRYLLEEALASGITDIVFVISPGKKNEILDYFKKSPKLEKILKERKKEAILAELKELDELVRSFSFSFAIQKRPLGDGHAILQTKKIVGDEPCAVFFTDDIVDSKAPCLLQLLQVYKTCQKPVVALKKIPQEKISHYGIAATDKIAARLYKIKKIVEKPSVESAPSDLAVVGRYVLVPEVFDYLKKIPFNHRGEIILADALEKMTRDGKIIYGQEIEGEWLECGDKSRWLHSFFYFSLKHQKYGDSLKKYLKKYL